MTSATEIREALPDPGVDLVIVQFREMTMGQFAVVVEAARAYADLLENGKRTWSCVAEHNGVCAYGIKMVNPTAHRRCGYALVVRVGEAP